MRRGRGTEGFRVIRVYDPAIDYDSIAQKKWDEFVQTRDADLLEGHFFPGKSPTIFHVRPLSQTERRDVRGKSESDRFERAFAFCVTRVENLATDDDGHEPWTRPNDGAKPRPLSDDALSRFAEEDILHVGAVIVAASFSSPDRPLFVPLLGTCRDALTAAALVVVRSRRPPAEPTSAT